MSEAGASIQDSSIVGDLFCFECQYNLRGLDSTGTCPECGTPISNSFDHRVDGLATAPAVRQLGNSYLLIIGAPCLLPLVIALALRIDAMRRLRFGRASSKAPELQSRMRLLWIMTIVEATAATAGILFLLVMPWPQGNSLMQIFAAVVFSVMVFLEYLCGELLLGRWCNAVVTCLRHHRLKHAFKTLFVSTIVCAVLSMAFTPLGFHAGGPGLEGPPLLGIAIVIVFDLLFAVTLLDLARELQREPQLESPLAMDASTNPNQTRS